MTTILDQQGENNSVVAAIAPTFATKQSLIDIPLDETDLQENLSDPPADPEVPAPETPAAPVNPAPVEPAPEEPAPVEPAPVEPAPVEPTPVEPAPVVPAPVVPAPALPAPAVPVTVPAESVPPVVVSPGRRPLPAQRLPQATVAAPADTQVGVQLAQVEEGPSEQTIDTSDVPADAGDVRSFGIPTTGIANSNEVTSIPGPASSSNGMALTAGLVSIGAVAVLTIGFFVVRRKMRSKPTKKRVNSMNPFMSSDDKGIPDSSSSGFTAVPMPMLSETSEMAKELPGIEHTSFPLGMDMTDRGMHDSVVLGNQTWFASSGESSSNAESISDGWSDSREFEIELASEADSNEGNRFHSIYSAATMDVTIEDSDSMIAPQIVENDEDYILDNDEESIDLKPPGSMLSESQSNGETSLPAVPFALQQLAKNNARLKIKGRNTRASMLSQQNRNSTNSPLRKAISRADLETSDASDLDDANSEGELQIFEDSEVEGGRESFMSTDSDALNRFQSSLGGYL
ncbi:MAG: hypothetical protein SGCHY_003075 [Lobulomycetales sp.]